MIVGYDGLVGNVDCEWALFSIRSFVVMSSLVIKFSKIYPVLLFIFLSLFSDTLLSPQLRDSPSVRAELISHNDSVLLDTAGLDTLLSIRRSVNTLSSPLGWSTQFSSSRGNCLPSSSLTSGFLRSIVLSISIGSERSGCGGAVGPRYVGLEKDGWFLSF